MTTELLNLKLDDGTFCGGCDSIWNTEDGLIFSLKVLQQPESDQVLREIF